MRPIWTKSPSTTPPGHLNAGLEWIANNPRIPSVEESLASLRPDLVGGWDIALNAPLRPEDVTPGSTRKVWWRCDAGPDHVWQATIGNRVYGSGCPCCAGRKLSVTNSLMTLYPSMAAEWDLKANGGLTPEEVLAGTKTRYHWRCRRDPRHRWIVAPRFRVGGASGCPHCARANRRSPSAPEAGSSLLDRFPNIAAEWHPTANRTLGPGDIKAVSGHTFWWRCAKDAAHEWRARVCNRTSTRKSGCPHCKKDVVSAKLAARVLSGRAFQSSLEKAGRELLSPQGFRYYAIVREAHRFDLGNPALNAVVEVNGCYWHDHRATGAVCPTTVRVHQGITNLSPAEIDERTRDIARRADLALLELWECERTLWPEQAAAFLASLQSSAGSSS